MMNVKETLKRLHKKFPMMGLDELFDVLDCYIEEVDLSKTISTWKPSWEQPKIWYSTDKTTSETPAINCITSKNADPLTYTLNSIANETVKYHDGECSAQLTADH